MSYQSHSRIGKRGFRLGSEDLPLTVIVNVDISDIFNCRDRETLGVGGAGSSMVMLIEPMMVGRKEPSL